MSDLVGAELFFAMYRLLLSIAGRWPREKSKRAGK
jgi:hypothetical protein